ncbi:hypothetical protein PISMIDRAFT_687593 [Pisolithus microcarpus 441]|uniref:Cytochrome P450 n=1 Tax=Pisolithus microcarpus 441 TaxID=765257 RepID=A0A0C9Z4Q3_9AGAM|nr:hypothetical protein PISMIDRAFT_687593 [Pisolithus microcarpus 441]
MFEDRIFTAQPEHNRAILAMLFCSFNGGLVHWDQLSGLLGIGVFTSDGETWKSRRSVT